MSRNVCPRCSKPVYFAERKTSLGRDWHPTCLKCIECGRVLSPGQHAEHKNMPYCTTPCYKALFGPALLGYGSNIASPANFATAKNAAEFGHDYDDDVYKREIYSNSRTSAAVKRQRQRRSAPPSILNHDFSALGAASGSGPQPLKEAWTAESSGSSQSIAGTNNSSPLALDGSKPARRRAPTVAAESSGSSQSIAGNGSHLVLDGSPPARRRAPTAPLISSAGNSRHSLTPSGDSIRVENTTSSSVTDPVPVRGHSRSRVPFAGTEAVTGPESDGLGSKRKAQSGTKPTGAKSKAVPVRSGDHRSGSAGPKSKTKSSAAAVRPSVNNYMIMSTPSDVSSLLNSAHEGSNSVPSVLNSSPLPSSVSNQSAVDPTHSVKSGHVTSSVMQDLLKKVESFNSHFEGKVHHQMTVEQSDNGEVQLQGPLRIYWGLSRPIRLRQCDDIPSPPIAKWRHSLCASAKDAKDGSIQNNNTPLQKLPPIESPVPQSPHKPRWGVDDSVLRSPATTDEVVMRRRPNIRKFNTVAYRSDAPTKWKRASINGHIFNYDTSVFTPVLGSSTSVIADNSMTTPVVIATLLDKFKVENSPGEYVLSVVTESGEQTQERELQDGDRPLLERLQLGADDQCAKIFLKERCAAPLQLTTLPEASAATATAVHMPTMAEEEEEEEERLPHDVEQLMILPVAVLKGVLVKYENDEKKDVKRLKAKFDWVRRKIRHRLEEMKTA